LRGLIGADDLRVARCRNVNDSQAFDSVGYEQMGALYCQVKDLEIRPIASSPDWIGRIGQVDGCSEKAPEGYPVRSAAKPRSPETDI
jgi:hypothetical protein